MADDQDKLRQSLAELQAQLESLRQVDPVMAGKLEATIAQAQSVLNRDQAPDDFTDEEHESLVEQLNDAVLKYEASHPTLAGTLGSVIDALGQMGI